jgi:hypothetical protein
MEAADLVGGILDDEDGRNAGRGVGAVRKRLDGCGGAPDGADVALELDVQGCCGLLDGRVVGGRGLADEADPDRGHAQLLMVSQRYPKFGSGANRGGLR